MSWKEGRTVQALGTKGMGGVFLQWVTVFACLCPKKSFAFAALHHRSSHPEVE